MRKECSWFASCSADALRPADGTYTTYSFDGTPFGKRRATPLSTTRLPLRPFAEIERLLVRAEGGSMRVGEKHTPGGGQYGDPSVALSEAQLDRAVSGSSSAALQSNNIPRRGLLHSHSASHRLPCFVAAASRRPVTIAALGGSITSGLAFGTFTGDDHIRSHWLYHRKLASWLSRTWPNTNGNARNNSYNAGLPAVGPAFSTLCLHSLLPKVEPPVDLVLLECAISSSTAAPSHSHPPLSLLLYTTGTPSTFTARTIRNGLSCWFESSSAPRQTSPLLRSPPSASPILKAVSPV